MGVWIFKEDSDFEFKKNTVSADTKCDLEQTRQDGQS